MFDNNTMNNTGTVPEVHNVFMNLFEAHGYCKSFVFDGEGHLDVTSKIVETPLTKKERLQNKIFKYKSEKYISKTLYKII